MNYNFIAQKKIEELRTKEDIIILGIESSCDETAASITKGRDILSNVISSQIAVHAEYGGVVPEIASRKHTSNIGDVIDRAIKESGLTLDDIDAVAVTYGAGLQGALLVGIAYAKALAYATGKPLIAVNHIKGHIAANYIAHRELKPPYICLVVSGGHTAIARVDDYDKITILGSTTDDACGEAFDKVARVLGLSYPGGPKVEKLAYDGNNIIPMPIPYKGENHYNFSYSGLKTAVINYVHKLEQSGQQIVKEDVACSFQTTAIGMLVEKTIKATLDCGLDTIAIAGGVGANGYLRKTLSQEADKHNLKALFPPKEMCTDNAVMICSEAYNIIRFSNAKASDLSLDAQPSIPLV